ncbi:hypothetical protein DPEC_G00142840 [Dallia pectoralis]|uniref:Uncharacterized protein n=1 Tax=Dallia pectoralis TaxID=75939 RepID=A0ACC2GNE7_DALPE|nr:hypothetical protein DPEC_G00142840 [Dallia pectoralis]
MPTSALPFSRPPCSDRHRCWPIAPWATPPPPVPCPPRRSLSSPARANPRLGVSRASRFLVLSEGGAAESEWASVESERGRGAAEQPSKPPVCDGRAETGGPVRQQSTRRILLSEPRADTRFHRGERERAEVESSDPGRATGGLGGAKQVGANPGSRSRSGGTRPDNTGDTSLQRCIPGNLLASPEKNRNPCGGGRRQECERNSSGTRPPLSLWTGGKLWIVQLPPATRHQGGWESRK